MDEKERENEIKFNFKQWLTKCNLTAIENIFNEYKMTKMDTLSMTNKNLSKLLSDKRICSNSKLVSMIIVSLQSLDLERNKYSKQNNLNNSSQIENNKTISEIEEKLNSISNLENRLKNININYQNENKLRMQYLKKSKQKYINDLNKSRSSIVSTFNTMYDVLKQKEHSLLTELEKYNVELDSMIDSNHNEQKNDDDDDDDEKYTNYTSNISKQNLFFEKYKSNEQIINDCKEYIDQQLQTCKYINSSKIKEIAKNIDNIMSNQIKRFNQNEKYMKKEISFIEKNKYNINTVSFKLNEQTFSNIIKEIDKIGEMLKYKKLEIEIKKIEWSDINHINIFYDFGNIENKKMINDINIQQYEINYRYFDINSSDNIDIDKFEWKTILFPQRAIINNKMIANPLNIKIDKSDSIFDINNISSDNETLIFIKMRVKHNPYYLWSDYSTTYKRKIANFLVVEKGQTIKLKLTQKKKKKSRRKSYALTHSSNQHSLGSNKSLSPRSPISSHNANHNNHKMNHSSYKRYPSTDLSEDSQTLSLNQYHQYYTFDSIIIKEGGTLTIEQNTVTQLNGLNGLNMMNGMGMLNSIASNQSMDTNNDDQNENQNSHPKGYLHMVIHSDLIIEKGGKINVSGLGYQGGGRYESGDSFNSFGELGQTSSNVGGGGGSKTYELGCGGGGGYSSKGDNGCSGKGFGFGNKTKYRDGIDGEGGNIYGDEKLSVCHFGSGGGGGDFGDSKGGNGGGIIIIDCKKNIVMHDQSCIKANGQKGKYDSDGCGSGGTVFISCNSLSMKNTSSIQAIGGKNNLKGNGGNGGNGRIRIKCNDRNVPWNKYYSLITPKPYLG